MVNKHRARVSTGRLRWIGAAMVAAGVLLSTPAHAQVEEDLKAGDRYFEQEDFKKAAKYYNAAIRKYPKQVSPEAYGKRAAIFLIQKDYEAGLKFIAQKAESQYPGAPEVLEYKALMLWALGSKPDAIAIAEKVVAKKKSTFSNQKIIGEFYAVREPEKAITAYHSYLDHRPGQLAKGDVLPRVRLGFAHLSVGHKQKNRDHYEQARTQFETLLKKHKNQTNAAVNANNGLCATYTILGMYDRAITLCEKIIQDPRRIDRRGSVWYNLGQAYLAKKQPKRARTAGTEFTRMRKSEPRGYLLIGDSHMQERNWEGALDAYIKAEGFAKGNAVIAAKLGIKLGISYRRLNRLTDAIAKLEAALLIDSRNMQLVGELGNAYIADKQDTKALTTATNLIGDKSFAGMSKGDKTTLLVIAGRAAYNIAAQKDRDAPKKNAATVRKMLVDARGKFEAARALRPKEVKVRIGLVQTMNYQAYREFSSDKPNIARAEKLLLEAYAVDKKAALTNQNLAVLALDRGQCSRARKNLKAMKKSSAHVLMYHRLMARSYMCQDKPDTKSAIDHYAKAEKKALQPDVQANLIRAEIYAEWAPLIMDKNLADAIDKLETAVQFAAQDPHIANAAKRNLALALFRRGWGHMRANRASRAAEDFAKAARDPRLLRGTELQAFEFSEALARLDSGESTAAAKLFKRLGGKGGQDKYLKAPYNKIGAQFFAAYAKYRSGNAALRRQAAVEFGKLQGKARGGFAKTVKSLLASTWQYLAYESHRNGKFKNAVKNLNNAGKYATSNDDKRTIAHNKAVLKMGRKANAGTLSTFSGMGSSPAEALVNKGIMLDRAGKTKEAYDAWVSAKGKGVRARNLQKWIDAKKRIFGY